VAHQHGAMTLKLTMKPTDMKTLTTLLLVALSAVGFADDFTTLKGKQYNEKLTAFVELESATRACGELS
jgi:hypothetical protein